MRAEKIFFAALIGLIILINITGAQSCTAQPGFASPCVNSNPVLTVTNPTLSGSNVNFNVNVNFSSSPVNAIYATGYYWSAAQNQWISFTMTGTPYPGTDGSTWLMNTASKSLSVPTSAASGGVIYAVVWEYTYVNNVWTGPSCTSAAGCWRLASLTVPQSTDTTPPVRSGSSPSGTLTTGTTQTTISLQTNEAATCKYATSTGVSYTSMTNTFTTTGSTSHSRIITGLSNGNSYNYYVRCIDAANNTNTNDFTISFSVASSTPSGFPTAVGWTQISNTQLSSVCPPNQFGYDFQFYCADQGAVTGAWNGGIADTKRNRLIVWGGGHGDYAGNEVYALDLNALQMKRLNDPSPPISGTSDRTSDGKANSRHTYDGLAYIESLDKMYVFGGALWRGGQTWSDTWYLDLATLQWEFVSGAGAGPTDRYNSHAQYDPVSKRILLNDRSAMWWFDPVAKTYTRIGSMGVALPTSSVLDPVRRIFLTLGGHYDAPTSPDIQAVNVDTGQAVNLALSGCSAITQPQNGNREGSGPAMAYDPVTGKIVAWMGGPTVYLLDLGTQSCTSIAFSTGPGVPETQGTFGRFRYFPAFDAFVLVNKAGQDAYVLRLRPGA